MNELDGFLGEMHKDANFLRGLMSRIKSIVPKNTPTKRDMLKATEKTKNYLMDKAPSKMDVMRGAVKARDLSKNKAVQTTALGVGAYEVGKVEGKHKKAAYKILKKASLGVEDIEDSLGIYFDDKLEAMARDKIQDESKKHFSLRNRKWMGPLTLGIGPAIAENNIKEKMIRDLARHYPKVRNARIKQREHQKALEIARANAPSYTNNTYVRDSE
jgi:hypothetical protein